MKNMWPFGLVALGLLIILAGFVYDVWFAGIPYQDPTPAMQAAYNYHAKVASIIRWVGAGFVLLSVLTMLLRRIRMARSSSA